MTIPTQLYICISKDGLTSEVREFPFQSDYPPPTMKRIMRNVAREKADEVGLGLQRMRLGSIG